MDGNSIKLNTDIALLEIIYGECVKPIFSKLAFVWDEHDNKQKGLTDSLNGTIVTLDGRKVIDETVDDVIEMLDKQDNIVGYIVLLNGKMGEYRKIKPGDILADKLLAIVDESWFKYLDVKANFYTKKHPDITVDYNFKKYTAKFDGDKLTHFKAIT